MSCKMFRILAALLLAAELADSRGVLYYKEEEGLDGACSGTANSKEPWFGEPAFVRQIANGTLYTAGDGEDMIYGTKITVHVLETIIKSGATD